MITVQCESSGGGSPTLPPGLHQVERVAGTPRHDKLARSLLYSQSWSLVFYTVHSTKPLVVLILQKVSCAGGGGSLSYRVLI